MANPNPDQRAKIESLSPTERAVLLKALRDDALRTQEPLISRRSPADAVVPLSFAQQGLWLLDQLQPANPTYNEHWAIHFHGELEVGILQCTLSEIVRRHEALRTFFPLINGNPVQVIGPPHDVTFPIQDLSGMPNSRQDAEIQKSVDDPAWNHFNLAELPLMRMMLFQLGERHALLLITAHHIAFDGWSIGLFRYELAELYKAFRTGRSSPLAELTIQYADFAIWQRRQLREDVLGPHLHYWTQQLENLPPLLQLPVTRPRPEVESFRGARGQMRLGEPLTKELKALSRGENVTLFMTLLAVFQTLLFRYSNQTDIPVGTVIANRNPAACEQLIGCFVNTLVLRGNLSGDPTFRELLQRIGKVAIEAYEHQELPFELLVDALQPERSLSYNPLFQFMFILQNTPKLPVELSEVTTVTAAVDSGTSKFDLTLSMTETAEGLEGIWEYKRELFDPGTIERMIKHFQTLTAAIIADPDRAIGTYPLLDPIEWERVVVDWNDTSQVYPREQCIHQLIADQAQRTPDRIALTDGAHSLSYQDLVSRANQLAAYLQRLGVGPEVPVGVCLPRSLDAIVGLLGILNAGGAFIPLDPACPQQRLTDLLKTADIRLILAQSGREWNADAARVIELDVEWPMVAGEKEKSPNSAVTPDNLAYVIYTSGSTGKPKGVLVSHRNLVHSTSARWSHYSEPVTAFLLVSPLTTDSSMAGIFWTLTQGGTLVLLAQGAVPDVPGLFDLVDTNQVSHLLSIPSLYDELLQDPRLEALVSLKTVIVAGESCPPKVIERHHEKLAHAALFNEYGPTEGSVWSSVYRCDSGKPLARIPIGRPVANTQIYLLDDHLQPVPIGLPAELYIGGAGVARGYHNSPGLTAGKFIADPFGNQPGARLYRTGDHARYLPDGNLELMGRHDQQVKIRGFRIELGGVGAAMLEHPAVREAVAVVREKADSRRLVAYVSVQAGHAVSVDELRGFLRNRLSSYAIPSDFVFLDTLPKLTSGKVNYHSLSALDLPMKVGVPPVADWSPLEQALARLWQETLQIESVGPNDNFFKIGGDSLSMVRLYNRLRTITDQKVLITDLFKNPTIALLAQFLSRN